MKEAEHKGDPKPRKPEEEKEMLDNIVKYETG